MYIGGIENEFPIIARPGQVLTDDFVGCIKSLSVNGNMKDFKKDSLNYTGLNNICNRVEGGACNKNNECEPIGTCLDRWSHAQCSCGTQGILSSDCKKSLEPYTLTEDHDLEFIPTSKYSRIMNLDGMYRGNKSVDHR